MSDKLARAKHTHEAVQKRLAAQDASLSEEALPAYPIEGNLAEDTPDMSFEKTPERSVDSSALLISICTIISRITGFARTWAMAFALGTTALSSAYHIANTLPNMLFELVAGGMIATAFLPVYISTKKKLGKEGSNAYASNLMSLVVVFLGIITIFSLCFPSLMIYTQSFLVDQNDMVLAIFFFQFFAIQIIFYGISSILSGLLNANRDYLWSSIAPIFNNVIVIGTFLAFAIVSPSNPDLALYIIAIGNPLGVFVQMVIQMPALKRNGIKIRPRIAFRDPALKETLSLAVPAFIVVLCSFAIVSMQNAAALTFDTKSGPAILQYSRLWFTLPYAFLTVPIATAMFTELSDMHSDGDIEGVKRGIVSGTNQILFFMVPFALYLMVFSTPLIMLYRAGAFTVDDVSIIANYLMVLAFALPFYGVNTYMERVFASLRKMSVFAIFNVAAAIVQIALTALAASYASQGIPITSIAAATSAFYILADIGLFIYLKKTLHPFKIGSLATTFIRSLLLGALGAALGGGVLFSLQAVFAPLSGSIGQAFVYVVISGLVSLLATFGIALVLRLPEAAFLGKIINRLTKR